MIAVLLHKAGSLLKHTNERSSSIRKNILVSFLVKGGSIGVSLLLVPVSIGYISPYRYGIWLTISSVIAWISFFDVGMGNGLRNKLTAAVALGEYKDARRYISTTYALLSIVAAAIGLCTFLVSALVNWAAVFKTDSRLAEEIRVAVLVVLFCFCVQFVVQLINTVLTALHRTSQAAFLSLLGQAAILAVLLVLRKMLPGNFTAMVLVWAGMPVLILALAGLVFYRTSLRAFAPAFRLVDFSCARELFNKGSIFFLIQLGALVLFQTDNIIIYHVIGAEAVTRFNVAYKLFSMLTMGFTIIITPYWSAFADAYAQQDFEWIGSNVRKMRKLVVLLSVAALLLCVYSTPLYRIWLGNDFTISVALSLSMALYVIAYMWQTLHVYMLNGIGKIRLQLLLVTCSAIANVPMSLYMADAFGLAGVVTANTLVFIVMGLLFSEQTNRIIHGKANGIWNR